MIRPFAPLPRLNNLHLEPLGQDRARPKMMAQPQPPASTDDLSSLQLNTGRLVDHPTDKSSAEMIRHTLDLRAAAARGETIEPGDLVSYGKTSVGNHVEVALDRDYFTEFVLPEIRGAKDSIHIAMLTFDGGHFGQYLVDLLIEKSEKIPIWPFGFWWMPV